MAENDSTGVKFRGYENVKSLTVNLRAKVRLKNMSTQQQWPTIQD